MSEIIIHDDENFERALKRFKKKCEKAGILSDLRKHRHYEKPSERRKRRMNAAMRKNRRSRHASMSALLARLQGDMVIARKAQDKPGTLLLSTILADIKNRRIELMRDPTDDDVVEVLRRGIKRRRESIEAFDRGARADLAGKERAEVQTLERYLPAAVPPETIRAAVRAAVAAGATTLGAVMGKVLPQFKGQTDGATVSAIVREELSARG